MYNKENEYRNRKRVRSFVCVKQIGRSTPSLLIPLSITLLSLLESIWFTQEANKVLSLWETSTMHEICLQNSSCGMACCQWYTLHGTPTFNILRKNNYQETRKRLRPLPGPAKKIEKMSLFLQLDIGTLSPLRKLWWKVTPEITRCVTNPSASQQAEWKLITERKETEALWCYWSWDS